MIARKTNAAPPPKGSITVTVVKGDPPAKAAKAKAPAPKAEPSPVKKTVLVPPRFKTYGPGKKPGERCILLANDEREAQWGVTYLGVHKQSDAPPQVLVLRGHAREFLVWHAETPKVPAEKLAAEFVEHARNLGGSEEAMEALRGIVLVAKEHIIEAVAKHREAFKDREIRTAAFNTAAVALTALGEKQYKDARPANHQPKENTVNATPATETPAKGKNAPKTRDVAPKKPATVAAAKKVVAAPPAPKAALEASAKAAVAPMIKAASAMRAGRTSEFAGKKISVLKKDHGARGGTKRALLLGAVIASKTYEEAIGKSISFKGENVQVSSGDIRFAVEEGLIKLS